MWFKYATGILALLLMGTVLFEINFIDYNPENIPGLIGNSMLAIIMYDLFLHDTNKE